MATRTPIHIVGKCESSDAEASSPVEQTPPRRVRKTVYRSPFQRLQRLRSRRSRSAPPALRTPIIEQHYRIESERRVVLPGVPRHEDDWARDSHDFFNLIVPCGLTGKKVTSLKLELGYEIDMDEIRSKMNKHFIELFAARLIHEDSLQPGN